MADERTRSGPGSGAAGPQSAGNAASAAAGELPQIDFSTFVISLSTSALYNLGIVPDPASGEHGQKNLVAARQTIDILDMLRERTRGNLDDEETRLLDSLLYELRMRYVEASG